ncbi:hypothetical protein [Kosakonia sp. 1610]|uniref:hypothetical protein n=1 Tax=Kosakonia sp. 1610 TaxID=3156426 RepID=UPI003D241465
MGFFTFDRLITPSLMSIFYALCVIVCVWMAIDGGGIIWIVGALFVRIPLEFTIVAFKCCEYLRDICEQLPAKPRIEPDFKRNNRDADFN